MSDIAEREMHTTQLMAIQRNCASHFVQIGSQCKYFNPGENNSDQSDFRCLNLGKVRLLSLPCSSHPTSQNKGKRKLIKNFKLQSTPFVVTLLYPPAAGSDIHSPSMSVGRTWLPEAKVPSQIVEDWCFLLYHQNSPIFSLPKKNTDLNVYKKSSL